VRTGTEHRRTSESVGCSNDHIAGSSRGECGEDGEIVIRAGVTRESRACKRRHIRVEWFYPVVKSPLPVHRIHDMHSLGAGESSHMVWISARKVTTNGRSISGHGSACYCSRASSDSYDAALSESFDGLYKAELIRECAWRGLHDLEFETLECVNWFNHQRQHGGIGVIPPGE
jgi:Integrase core domain